MNEKKILRYRVLVDKKFQTRFIFHSLFLMLMIIALILLLVLYDVSREPSSRLFTPVIRQRDSGVSVLPLLVKISLVVFTAAGLWALWNLLKYSHKIIGPLVRFKRILRELGNANLTVQIKFREGDELQELALTLTESMGLLNKKIKAIQQDFDLIFNTLQYKNVRNLNHTDMILMNNKLHKMKSLLRDFKTN
ncbi:MAG: methyl-accepting chemotaxis protein [bacterium]|nr:methyl-accepting chemotaxis protein [bacterium]